ncbi:MAG: radical SAM family heme chaperone HemW [Treponema sp.]|nr:radical SAM family heme chaperone HemW [Treponema sp.]
MKGSVSLYIHIPFCSSFCDYCDFYSEKIDPQENNYINSFIKALINDIREQIKYFSVNEIETVYIGGGTPSLLGKNISTLLDELKKLQLKNYNAFSPLEFTVEVNPESVTEEFLYTCKDKGVNRISLGVQTFHEPCRIAVNRKSDENMLMERLALVSKLFPGSFSADLITGLPFQKEKIVLEDINKILSFNPVHISLYALSVEDKTLLKEKIENREIEIPSEEEADSLWLAGCDALLKKGFNQYEISNFAIKEKICIHNMRYWQMQSWIGAGPAASGTIVNEDLGTAKRFTYREDVKEYLGSHSIETAISEDLDKQKLIRESILMGFRCIKGADANVFKQRFGFSLQDCIPKTLERWEKMDKMLFLNQFLSDAFSELDSGENS